MHGEDEKNLTLPNGLKYMANVGLVQVGLCGKMSPRKLVILSAIRRPSYKAMVAPNIYITTCYE